MRQQCPLEFLIGGKPKLLTQVQAYPKLKEQDVRAMETDVRGTKKHVF